MSASIVFHLLAAIAYGILAITLWRPITQGRPKAILSGPSRIALLLAIVMQGAGLLLTIVLPHGLHLGWALALSAAVWLGMVIFWFDSLFLRLDSLLLILLPAATLVSLCAALFPNGTVVLHGNSTWLRAHLIIALIAYGLITVSALHAIFMTMLERQLHQPAKHAGKTGVLYRALDTMPPLLVLETLLFRIIRFGFFVLTLTVITGIIVSYHVEGTALPLDHKTVFTLLSWVTFGALLIGRHIWGWRGPKALHWTLIGFAFLLLSYSGTRFVLDVLLHRGTLG